MAMSDRDTEYFIQCIRDRPALWDKDMEDYTNRGIREQLWADIGEIIFAEEWPQLDLKSRTEKVKDIKNRWRHMRDSYIKQLRGNQPRKRKREYLHAHSLTFIGELVKRKKETAENEALQSEDDQNTGDVDDTTFVKMEPEYITSEVSLMNESYQNVEQRSASLPIRGMKSYPYSGSFKSGPLNPLETSPDQDEADRLFLMSILPDYRKLDEDEKIDFRILVLEYFREVRRKRKEKGSAGQEILQPNYTTQEHQQFLG